MQNTDDETLVYDLAVNKAFLLNETSAFVWQNCDGRQAVSEISIALAKRNRQPINEDIVWLAIDQLKSVNLMENAGELKSKFEGLNRREVVKKIGLASMMTLPVISSLVAPTAVSAGSTCVANGMTCTFNNSTQSNCCPGSRCDNFPPPTCRNCLRTGVGFGSGTTVDQCNALGTKNLCCNPTGTPTISTGACLCP